MEQSYTKNIFLSPKIQRELGHPVFVFAGLATLPGLEHSRLPTAQAPPDLTAGEEQEALMDKPFVGAPSLLKSAASILNPIPLTVNSVQMHLEGQTVYIVTGKRFKFLFYKCFKRHSLSGLC